MGLLLVAIQKFQNLNESSCLLQISMQDEIAQTVGTSPTSTTRVVTQQMANKDRRLRPFVGKEIQFELKEDGQYYPVLGD